MDKKPNKIHENFDPHENQQTYCTYTTINISHNWPTLSFS